MKVCLTVDMEQDCPPFLNSYRGVIDGTPALLSVLAEEKIPATFFTTGDVARRFPETVEKIVQEGHELGCHGDSHRRFDQMNREEAASEIDISTKTLRHFYPVTSFRAPNLQFPAPYLSFLEKQGYALDSSEAKYKRREQDRAFRGSLHRVPASVTSSVLRLPKWFRYFYFRCLKEPVVLFVHPWEFVDWQRSSLRLDCRFRTGAKALECLSENIHFFKRRWCQFVRLQELTSSTEGQGGLNRNIPG